MTTINDKPESTFAQTWRGVVALMFAGAGLIAIAILMLMPKRMLKGQLRDLC